MIKEINTKYLLKVFMILLALLVSGCATVSTSGGYNLKSGETVRGHLIITSGVANLENDSRVTGNVYMTSGELNADGEIDGDIVFTSGNVNLGSDAVVGDDIKGTSGNFRMEEGARVEGRISGNQSTFTMGAGFFARVLGKIYLLPIVLVGGLIFLVILLRRIRSAAPTPAVQEPGLAASNDPGQALKQLKKMQEEGLITKEDYEAKKADILSKM